MYSRMKRRIGRVALFVSVMLAIELLDELVFGVEEAAWPLIRNDLMLSYVQIGLLMSLPKVIGTFIEPALGILADTWKRGILIIGGGIGFTLALLLTGISQSFPVLLIGLILFYPSSGAFVGLAQAALMDYSPARHEHNMARWTFAGSVGVTLGPVFLSLALLAGYTWRTPFLIMSVFSLVVLLLTSRMKFSNGSSQDEDGDSMTFWQGLKKAWHAMKRPDVLRWLILLEFSDLMLDVLLGYLALYFVDVVGLTEAQAAIAVLVWTGVGLIGDFMLIFLLERIKGLVYLRFSAAVILCLYPAFLLVDTLALKLVLLALLGFFNAGWYAILKAQLYSAMPGQSGTVELTIGNVTGLIGAQIPLLIGVLASLVGLSTAMWFLWLGPVALLIGIPRTGGKEAARDE